jgi:tRNA(adenine34) deaminase
MNNDSPYELSQNHRKYMSEAIKLAEQAYNEDEVPVGSIVIHESRIIGKGYNQVEKLNDATAHAEMLSISAASSTLESKYLSECTLYVTLEPCPMCASAAVWAKAGRIVFGASDAKYGACGSVFNLAQNNSLNHNINIIQGVMEKRCEELLTSYFQQKREDENDS